jgi:hypothetical protein
MEPKISYFLKRLLVLLVRVTVLMMPIVGVVSCVGKITERDWGSFTQMKGIAAMQV